MYKKYFGLAEEPFNLTPDSRFLFLSERHREALAALTYGVRERKGFILLTGEIGSGKTTVCRAFVNELTRSNDVRLALILNPGLSEIELLKTINDEFQIPSFYNTKKGLIDELNRFLIEENQKGKNVVLIIDEAQNLDPDVLEQIRMLSNLETENEKLLQIVLVGQPELRDTLSHSQLEQLNQRIAVRYHLTPLTEAEVLAYIQHRLFVARATVAIEFTPEALRLLYNVSRGIPRRINVICDRALLACYTEATCVVDERIMQRAIDEVTRGGELASDSSKRTSSFALPRLNPETAKKAGRKLALWLGLGAGATLTMAIAIAIGIKLANVRASEGLDYQPRVTPTPGSALPKPGQPLELKRGNPDTEKDDIAEATETSASQTPLATKVAPTPTPDWETLRRKNPHWKYEKNVPLVRVNNPKAALRAAQFSLLKMWGFHVDLSELAKLGDDQIVNGVLQSDSVKLRELRLPGSFYDVVKYNVPLIVRMKDPAPDQSEYVVLLRAEGEAVTVGDPVWGVKTYKTKDFIKYFDSASAVFVDVNQLTSIQRGESSDRVRQLQEFLVKRGYLAHASGKFDVDTAEAIKKFQAYYKLRETGQIDDLTAMLLNSRMMDNGPHLAPTGD
ncbi:MAG: AAA family ATPase [Candidatus Sumerlaeaceae bacterium]|jgi:general secretion pathway protein A